MKSDYMGFLKEIRNFDININFDLIVKKYPFKEIYIIHDSEGLDNTESLIFDSFIQRLYYMVQKYLSGRDKDSIMLFHIDDLYVINEPKLFTDQEKLELAETQLFDKLMYNKGTLSTETELLLHQLATRELPKRPLIVNGEFVYTCPECERLLTEYGKPCKCGQNIDWSGFQKF